MVSLGGAVSLLVSSFGCVLMECGHSCNLVFPLLCDVGGFPHHHESARPYCFIYKVGRKPFSIKVDNCHKFSYVTLIDMKMVRVLPNVAMKVDHHIKSKVRFF